ncbi:MAG: hypothetical protein KJO40_19520 [Deltaproteobacteria bacterium]|nr:hypothetical protein [Deltaproteobacteria bacterium]
MSFTIKATAAVEESLMSEEQALAWAELHYERSRKWPTRRWRVDTAHCGNSRFLGRRAAHVTYQRYGGDLREIVPSRKVYCEARGIRRWTRHHDAAKGMDQCPWCLAPADIPCRQPNGRLRQPHVQRRQK